MPTSPRRRLASLIAVGWSVVLASFATAAVDEGGNANADGFVAAEERLALAEEAMEIADKAAGAHKIASTGSTVDSKYPPCPPSPRRGRADNSPPDTSRARATQSTHHIHTSRSDNTQPADVKCDASYENIKVLLDVQALLSISRKTKKKPFAKWRRYV